MHIFEDFVQVEAPIIRAHEEQFWADVRDSISLHTNVCTKFLFGLIPTYTDKSTLVLLRIQNVWTTV
jgi:hypothetical protein